MREPQASLLIDFYKYAHRLMEPEGTEITYATWTPRTSRIADVTEIVVFLFQAFVKKYLIHYFNIHFFNKDFNEIEKDFQRLIKHTLYKFDDNITEANIDCTHLRELHELGYLPLEIKALPEGSLCPIRVPCMTIRNTDKRFAWLPNYLESLASSELWQGSTSATLSYRYKKLLEKYAMETVGNTDFVPFQGHDFSFRGMSSLDSAISSGMGHLLSFVGTDTVPAIEGAEIFYNANVETELVGTSIPASEHSIQCAYADDMTYFKRLINEVHPSGFVSIVSDGYDFWQVMTEVVPALKEDILKRNGKVVIRPDSGDPVEIVCGKQIEEIKADTFESFQSWAADSLHTRLCDETPHGEHGGNVSGLFKWNNATYTTIFKVTYSPDWDRYDKQYYYIDYCSDMVSKCTFEEVTLSTEEKGAVESLWETFGGTISEQGYKVLDSHIGLIYGDAITYDRAKEICERLKAKGFASINVVYGVGSFTFQYNTRDTFGWALKTTYNERNGESIMIFKDPKTDDGTKKSQRGRVAVFHDGNSYRLQDGYKDLEDIQGDRLETIFLNGELVREHTFEEIRARLRNENIRRN